MQTLQKRAFWAVKAVQGWTKQSGGDANLLCFKGLAVHSIRVGNPCNDLKMENQTHHPPHQGRGLSPAIAGGDYHLTPNKFFVDF